MNKQKGHKKQGTQEQEGYGTAQLEKKYDQEKVIGNA